MRELLVFSFALLLSACGGGGGGGSSSGGSSPTVTAQNAPDAIAPGAVMSVNPTFSFSGGSFTYSNDNPFGQFTATVSNGLYTYIPYTGGTDKEGTLTLSGDGAADGKIFSGAGFRKAAKISWVGTASQLTGGTMTIDGAAYTLTLSGTPMMPGKGRSGGGTVVAQTTVPVSLNGAYNYVFGMDKSVTGCPYKQGDKAVLSIVGDTLTVNGVTMTATKLDEYTLRYASGLVAYVVSLQFGPVDPATGQATCTPRYVSVLVGDLFAGQFSASAVVLSANDSTLPAAGKTWTAVVTDVRNDTGSYDYRAVGSLLHGTWGVAAPNAINPGTQLEIREWAFQAGFSLVAENSFRFGPYSLLGKAETGGTGNMTVSVDPATNLVSQITSVETYPSGKVNSITLKVIGL